MSIHQKNLGKLIQEEKSLFQKLAIGLTLGLSTSFFMIFCVMFYTIKKYF